MPGIKVSVQVLVQRSQATLGHHQATTGTCVTNDQCPLLASYLYPHGPEFLKAADTQTHVCAIIFTTCSKFWLLNAKM